MGQLNNKELIKQWLAAAHITDTTKQWYARVVIPFVDHMGGGDLPLQLNTENLYNFKGQLRDRGLAPSSINTYLTIARMFTLWAYENGHIPKDLSYCLKPIKYQLRRTPRSISSRDRDQLIERAKNSDPLDHALTRWLAATGSRLSETANLNINDLEFRPVGADVWVSLPQSPTPPHVGRATIYGKGGKVRIVLFDPDTAAALISYIRFHRKKKRSGNRVFIGERGPLSSSGLRKRINRLAARGSVTSPVNPHAWRHRFALDLLRNGANIQAVADLMGHSASDITSLYLCHRLDELEADYLKFAPLL